MSAFERDDDDATALVLTTLADLLNGYPVRELADGWRDAAAQVATKLRKKGHDDDGTWDTFTDD